jgi:DNA primase
MAKEWVDFQKVREAVSMMMLLKHYGIDWLRKSRDELYGKCPIHDGEGTRAFRVNLSKNVFNCFSCGAKGGVLEFVAAMDFCDVRIAALKLQGHFNIPDNGIPLPANTRKTQLKENEEPAPVNPPLSFKLRVDPSHEYGLNRGLTPTTIQRFGAGICLSRGTFAGRYVIPLHDAQGRLVGYAGRSVNGTDPKYLFPSGKNGFRKSHLLFNLHRVLQGDPRDDRIILVEGFFDCMKVQQAGYPCVALLGSTLSKEQEQLLCQHFSHVVLLFDGDEAGRKATDDCLSRLQRHAFVRAIVLPKGKQPDMLSDDELQVLLSQ